MNVFLSSIPVYQTSKYKFSAVTKRITESIVSFSHPVIAFILLIITVIVQFLFSNIISSVYFLPPIIHSLFYSIFIHLIQKFPSLICLSEWIHFLFCLSIFFLSMFSLSHCGRYKWYWQCDYYYNYHHVHHHQRHQCRDINQMLSNRSSESLFHSSSDAIMSANNLYTGFYNDPVLETGAY